MNIVIRELQATRKSLIIWCVGVLFMVFAGMGKYAGMTGTGQTINELMAEMPESLQAIMGSGGFDLTKAIGYYGLLFLYLAMMATIHAVMLGANIVSKEERDKTAEFLLVKPISRGKVITLKLTASLINLVTFNLVTLVSSIVMVQRYAQGEAVSGDIGLLMIGMFFLQLLFLVVGTAIAAIIKRPKRAASISTGVLLLTFILSIAINLNDKLGILKFITPFKYYEAEQILNEGLDPAYLTISIILITVLTAITYQSYKKKDLNI
ncbi:ABC transporter permease subunit [Mesobacillus harenae]|uniref:ABC transporter permease subunit n=1 Tax=Mesobacillus harenae TaxID=2213203 RepID=UPI0015803FCF|nr:ABC transporter permease subunit [Mesobacillus harenae]